MYGATAGRAGRTNLRWLRWPALAVFTFISVGIVANPGNALLWDVLNNLSCLAVSIWATVTILGASRRCQGRERYAWLVMAAGTAVWAVGQVFWSWYSLILRTDPPMASPMDALFLAAPLFWTASMLTFVIAPAGLWSRIRGALEAIMVVGAAFVPAWILILEPVASQSTESRLVVTVNIFYPVLDLLVLGAALFTLTRPRLQTAGRLGIAAWGLLVMSGADTTYWYLTTTGRFQHSNATDSLWIMGFVLLALGVGTRPRTRPQESTLGRRWWLTMSPSLVYGVGLITTFLILTAAHGYRVNAWELAAIITLALLGTMQSFAVMIENHYLTDGLENTVIRRTAELAARERYFQSLGRQSSDIVAVVDPDGTISWVSNAVEGLYGLLPSHFMGSQIHERPSLAALSAAIRAGRPEVQWELTDNHGRTRWAHSTISDLRSDDDVGAFVINTRDVTDQVVLEQQLRHQAFHDPLTGLPNRVLFAERLTQALNRARSTRELVAVAVIDLNGFKVVNDSHGHHAGDSVLRSVATRLATILGDGVTVARLGGDEFAVLFDRVDSVADAERLGNEIVGHLRHDVVLGSTTFRTSGSVGVALALPGVEVTVDRLLRDADIAMYRAKSSGSSTAVVFAEEMHQQAQQRYTLESELNMALERDEFRVYYQPVYCLTKNEIRGFEALLRWEHPERGVIGPFDFIPIAEATGLIVPIGEWVLRTAIHQLADWARVFGDKGRLTMAVNVSVGQLRSDRIVELLREEVAAAGIDPTRLTVEITESMVVTEDRAVVERLRAISDLGVRLAIDDFGTGYASIANLRRLPIDVLKIDRQFVAEADVPGENLLGPIVQIGNAFGLTTVAEGIETVAQLERLRELGYQLGQGYLFAPPVAARSAREMLLQQYGGDETQSSADRRRDQRSARTASSPWVPGW